jgi:hypothetical protein
VIYFVTHVFITLARHPDPERSEGEGPHAMGSVITFVAERGTSCNVHAKHELPPALRYACAVRDDGRTMFKK